MYKKLIIYCFLIILGLSIVQAETPQKTYIIPIKGEINGALVTFLDKAISEAEANDAAQIIFEIDTPGGLVEQAEQISELIMSTTVPTISYIKNNAISAGVIITISSNRVIANKAINIGSAETRPKEEKYLSYWVGKLKTVAELKGRDPEIIAGMADVNIEIEGIKEKGKLLNLTASEALQYGIVDKVVDGKVGLFDYIGVNENDVILLDYDFQTKIAHFTNSVFVSTILISLGIIGIVGEVFTAGFGLFGSIGIMSFALFFAGRVIAGHAGWGILILFIAGIILLGIEVAIPGFGVPGLAGIACIILSIVIGSRDAVEAIQSFVVAIILSIIVLVMVFKFAPRNKLFDHIILKNEQQKSSGYVSEIEEKVELIGQLGEALTLLRPAGTINIGDKRIDVVSEGAYIKKGSKVKVIAVEGNRVVVRKIEQTI